MVDLLTPVGSEFVTLNVAANGSRGFNMDLVDISDLWEAEITAYSPISITLDLGRDPATGWVETATFGGSFIYDANEDLAGGTLTEMILTRASNGFHLQYFSVPIPTAMRWLELNDRASAFDYLFSVANRMIGSDGSDLLRGHGGNDVIDGKMGFDTIFGGDGNDIIRGGYDTAAQGQPISFNFLRGEAGNDELYGGRYFDNMHGNTGYDTLHGGDGNDWVVGGQDGDLLYGDSGDDYIVANLGADTLRGGSGNDTLLGGQADDLIIGSGRTSGLDDGRCWISGDRGNDTISGLSGADTFNFFVGAGLDRVVDFSQADGDRIHLYRVTSWEIRQEGSDTVVDLGGGDRIVLVGVDLGTLTDGWLIHGG